MREDTPGRLGLKCLLFQYDFKQTQNTPRNVCATSHYSNFMKIHLRTSPVFSLRAVG